MVGARRRAAARTTPPGDDGGRRWWSRQRARHRPGRTSARGGGRARARVDPTPAARPRPRLRRATRRRARRAGARPGERRHRAGAAGWRRSAPSSRKAATGRGCHHEPLAGRRSLVEPTALVGESPNTDSTRVPRQHSGRSGGGGEKDRARRARRVSINDELTTSYVPTRPRARFIAGCYGHRTAPQQSRAPLICLASPDRARQHRTAPRPTRPRRRRAMSVGVPRDVLSARRVLPPARGSRAPRPPPPARRASFDPTRVGKRFVASSSSTWQRTTRHPTPRPTPPPPDAPPRPAPSPAPSPSPRRAQLPLGAGRPGDASDALDARVRRAPSGPPPSTDATTPAGPGLLRI